MKEIYQSSVKEVLGQMGSREEGLTIKEVESPVKNVDGMSSRRERKKVCCRFFWSSTRISW